MSIDPHHPNYEKLKIIERQVQSGGEVYNMLKNISPHIKVILSSGNSMEGQTAEILKRGCNGFI